MREKECELQIHFRAHWTSGDLKLERTKTMQPLFSAGGLGIDYNVG